MGKFSWAISLLYICLGALNAIPCASLASDTEPSMYCLRSIPPAGEDEYPPHRRPPPINVKLERLNEMLSQAAEGVAGNFANAKTVGDLILDDLYDYAVEYPIWGYNLAELFRSGFIQATSREIKIAGALYQSLDWKELDRFFDYLCAHSLEVQIFVNDPTTKPISRHQWMSNMLHFGSLDY